MTFQQYLEQNYSTIHAEAQAEALDIAHHWANHEAQFHFPPKDKGYLESDTPRWRSKIGFQRYTNAAGAPIIVLRNMKTGESHTINPAWRLYQGEARPPRPQPTLKLKPTVTAHCGCGAPLEQSYHTKCYYCHIDSLYQQGGSATAHPYLAAKGIDPALADQLGWRRHGRKLLIPLQGTVGYQVIEPNQKRYAVKDGLDLGHVRLGEVSQTTPRLWLAEGVATAHAVYQLLGEPVVACLSANLLLKQARHWREQYPEVELIILADNDVGSFFRHNSQNSQGIENPGKVLAYEAARAVGAKVALPPTDYKADWNDYLLAHPTTTIEQFEAHILPPPLLDGLAGYYRLNQRYLEPQWLDELLDSRPADTPVRIFVKSGLGTGKTSNFIQRACRRFERVRVYGHRQALSRNLADTLGIACYLDVATVWEQGEDIRAKMTMTINSIIQERYEVADLELVVVDEVEQVLSAIAQGTVEAKESTYSLLLHQMDAAKVSMLVDADLTPETVARLSAGFTGQVVVIENQHQPYANRPCQIFEDKGDLLAELKRHVLANEPIAIACGLSIDAGNAILKTLEQLQPDLKTIYINEKTAEQYADFTHNLGQGSFEPYDVVVYSPVYQAGVDIADREGHFKAIFGVFGGIHTAPEIWQMVGRIRSQAPLYLYAPKGGHYRQEFDPQQFLAEKLIAQEQENKALARHRRYTSVLKLANLSTEVTPAIQLQLDVMTTRNEQLKHLRGQLINQARQLGCRLTTLSPTDNALALKAELREVRQAYQHEQAEQVAESYNNSELHPLDLSALSQKKRLTSAERVLVQGHEVAQFYGCTDLSPAQMLSYAEDKAKVEALVALLSPTQHFELTDQMLESGANILDRQFHVVAWYHRRNIIQLLGGKFEGSELDVSEIDFSHESLWASELPHYLHQYQKSLNGCGLMGATVTPATLTQFKADGSPHEGLTRYVNQVLKHSGLSLKVSRKLGAMRSYQVDETELERLKTILYRDNPTWLRESPDEADLSQLPQLLAAMLTTKVEEVRRFFEIWDSTKQLDVAMKLVFA